MGGRAGPIASPPRCMAVGIRSVARTRLLSLLAGDHRRRLTMVVAPAGYGKTVLLSQWAMAEADDPVVWCSLRPEHNDADFLHGLFRSAERSRATTLVLDDFQYLTDARLLDLCAAVIERAPDTLHFVLASRSDLPSRYYKLCLSHAVTEIGAHDLAFTIDEAAELLEGTAFPSEELWTQTEGWATGLALAGDDRTVDQYLAHEILDRQPAHVRRFLLRTSVLERATGPLCDFILAGHQSHAVLDGLASAGAFITSTDARRTWFRYHPLFRAMLRRRLRRAGIEVERDLLRGAAEWHLARDDVENGVAYLIGAGAADDVIEAAFTHGPAIFEQHRVAQVARLIEQAPAGDGQAVARVRLLEAAATVLAEDHAGVSDFLDAADVPETSAADRVVGDLFRSYLALMDGSTLPAIRAAERVLAEIDDIDDAELPNLFGLTGSRADVLAAARVARAVARVYEGALSAAREDLEAVGDDCHGVWRAAALGARAIVEAWSGNLNSGEEFAHVALSLGDALDHSASSRTTAWFALALIARQRGDVEGAAGFLDEVEEAGGGDRRVVAMWLATERAHLALARDASAAARAVLGGQWVSPHPAMPEAIVARRRAAEALVLMARGDLDGAQVLLDVGLGETSEVTTARVRLAFERGNTPAVRSLVEAWQDDPQPRAGRERRLWTAIVDHLDGDHAGARAAMAAVVAEAEVEGDVGLFRAAGSAALGPARAVYRTAPTAFLRLLVDQPVGAGPAPAVKGLVEQLTDREYMVLVHLPSRQSNAEIATRLGVSLNTVKTHLKHIYRKLDVVGRNEAVTAAERWHLL